MKKLMMAAAMAAAASTALADDLADGIKAWEAQDFAKAHQLLGKAAAAGNPEAQLMVGEMYGFGEGVQENAATAESWIRKAQAGGHKDASESLNTLKQRGARKQDIAYYVSGYKGDELKLEKYGCIKPAIPAEFRVQTQKEIKQVRDAYEAWGRCYEQFGMGMAAARPVGKVIPPDVAKVMSLAELQQARTGMDKSYAAIATDSERQAREVLASYNAWVDRTKSYNAAMSKKVEDETQRAARDSNQLMERYRETVGSATTPGRR